MSVYSSHTKPSKSTTNNRLMHLYKWGALNVREKKQRSQKHPKISPLWWKFSLSPCYHVHVVICTRRNVLVILSSPGVRRVQWVAEGGGNRVVSQSDRSRGGENKCCRVGLQLQLKWLSAGALELAPKPATAGLTQAIQTHSASKVHHRNETVHWPQWS